jgi:hypothetical protein
MLLGCHARTHVRNALADGETPPRAADISRDCTSRAPHRPRSFGQDRPRNTHGRSHPVGGATHDPRRTSLHNLAPSPCAPTHPVLYSLKQMFYSPSPPSPSLHLRLPASSKDSAMCAPHLHRQPRLTATPVGPEKRRSTAHRTHFPQDSGYQAYVCIRIRPSLQAGDPHRPRVSRSDAVSHFGCPRTRGGPQSAPAAYVGTSAPHTRTILPPRNHA